MKLQNKVAVVTGSSRGIGYAIALGFIKEGAKVAICGSTLDHANQGVLKIKEIFPNADILPIALDVSSTNSIKEAFEAIYNHYQRIDILVNNAGVSLTRSIEEMTDEEYEKIMDINVAGTIKCTREVLKFMNSSGSIINISSMNGIYGSQMQTAYSASKAAVIGITKSLAKELGKRNIRVNAIAPGMIATDMVQKEVTDEVKQRLIAMTPLHRMGNVEDLQGICNLLASDESSFITGTVISVDGGLIM